MTSSSTALPFVGRSAELALMRGALEDLDRGVGSVHLLSGPGGIGKTRLMRETLAASTARTAMTRCWDDSVPMWPWARLLERLGLDGSTLQDPASSRLEMFEHLLGLLYRLEPTVLAIDDLHLADPASLLFTRFLARAEPLPAVLVLATVRPSNELSPEHLMLVDELARDTTTLRLGRLGEDDIAVLLAATGRADVDSTLIETFTQLTNGVPLAVEQTLELWGRSETTAAGGIEAAVEHAVGQIDPELRRIVASAAVFAPVTTLGQLRDLIGCTVPVAAAARAAALRVGLLADSTLTEIQFSHDLVREAVQHWLAPADRLAIHDAAVAMLRSAGDGGLAIAAQHAIAAAAISSDSAARAIELTFLAAQQYRRIGALESALEACTTAAQVAANAAYELSLAHRILHADAALAAGQLSLARGLYRSIADMAERTNDAHALADAALGLGGVWLCEHRADDVAAAVLALQERALQGIGSDPMRRTRLRVRIANEKAYHSQRFVAVDSLMAEARATRNPALIAETLSLAVHAKLSPMFAQERIRLSDEMVAAANDSGDALQALIAQCWRAVNFVLAGDQRAPRARRVLEQRCNTLRCASVQFIVEAMAVGDLISLGQFDEAEAAATSCYEFGRAVGDADGWNYFIAHMAVIRYFQGRHGELAQFAAESATSLDFPPGERAIAVTAGMFALAAGDRAPADLVVAEHRRRPEPETYQASTWLVAMNAMAILADDLHDAELGADVAQQLEAYRGLPVCVSMGVATLGPVDLPYAIALAASGRLREAIDAMADAASVAQSWNHRPATAIALAHRAEFLQRTGSPAGSRDLLEAIEIADAHRMTGWSERWRSMLALWTNAVADAGTDA